MTDSSFSILGVAEPLQRALAANEYLHPTPIQTQAIPPILAGRDILGVAQTGTGKTAAFGLPILQKLALPQDSGQAPRTEAHSPRALILAPTRELALQIAESLRSYGRHLRLRVGVVIGGVNQNKQIATLRSGVDILIATPGRLLDLAQGKHVRFGAVTTLVIDEADRMFDMGFIRDVRRIVSQLPRQRQSMLFSATMPGEVAHLVNEILRDPIRIDISPATIAVERIVQQVYFVPAQDKRAFLHHLLADQAMKRVIVFTRTKHGANKVVAHLERAGHVAEAIHGNKSQNARQRALEQFRSGRARILVATDIAARGIDIDDISHVVNFELPDVPESYVHRIGRTARAGAGGIAISFCDAEERHSLKQIEKLLKQPLAVMGNSPQMQRDPHAAEEARPAARPYGNKLNRHKPNNRRNAKNRYRRAA